MKTIARLSKIAAVAAATLTLPAGANAGLVAHYDFEGAVNADSSGNGRNLALGAGGPVQTVTGKFGNGGDFAGGGFMFSADSAFNLVNGDFAVSLWYRAVESGFSPLVGKNTSTSDAGWAISQSTIVSGDLNDATSGVVSTTAPADDEIDYQHLVYQKIGANLELYVNGVLVDTDTGVSGSLTGNALPLARETFRRAAAKTRAAHRRNSTG